MCTYLIERNEAINDLISHSSDIQEYIIELSQSVDLE